MAGSEIPATIGDFAVSLKGTTRGDFLARFPHPFLVRQNDAGQPGRNLSTTSFNTMAMDPQKIRARAREVLLLPIFAVTKRAGGNAFGLMITMGRAPNNDIVFHETQISKFHANFAKSAKGEWTITDSSSNGTWVDGKRLEARVAQTLRADSSIELAHAVVLTFLTPERAFDEVESILRRGTT
jgi:hypothetical protein